MQYLQILSKTHHIFDASSFNWVPRTSVVIGLKFLQNIEGVIQTYTKLPLCSRAVRKNRHSFQNRLQFCDGLHWTVEFPGQKLSSSGRWKRCLVKLRRLCYTIRRGSWSAVLWLGKTWYVGLVSWWVQEEAITRESIGDSGWGAGWLSTLCPLPLSNGTWDANMQNYKSPTILRAQYVVQVRTWLLTKRVEGRIQPAEMFFQLMV